MKTVDHDFDYLWFISGLGLVAAGHVEDLLGVSHKVAFGILHFVRYEVHHDWNIKVSFRHQLASHAIFDYIYIALSIVIELSSSSGY
jgi:hypothetical protein